MHVTRSLTCNLCGQESVKVADDAAAFYAATRDWTYVVGGTVHHCPECERKLRAEGLEVDR